MPTLYTSSQEQGRQDDVVNPNVQSQKFDLTLQGAKRVLYQCKSIFPFDFFPDKIMIDENKVDIIYGIFILSRQVFSIPIKNINGVTSTNDLFFGSLRVEIEGFNENPQPVKFLKKRDADKARRIINGLVMAYKNNINLSSLPLEDCIDQVEQIGTATSR